MSTKGATYRNTVPVLVYHHDAQEHTQRKEEQAVDIVLDGVTDSNTEREEENLGNSEECRAEDNVADGPAVIEGAENENKLGDNVNDCADEGPENVDDP